MANFQLTNGYSVRTTPAPEGATEFETKNPEGEVISVVYLNGAEATETLTVLRVNDALRFGEQYGGQVA